MRQVGHHDLQQEVGFARHDMGGHGDLLAGAGLGRAETVARILFMDALTKPWSSTPRR